MLMQIVGNVATRVVKGYKLNNATRGFVGVTKGRQYMWEVYKCYTQ